MSARNKPLQRASNQALLIILVPVAVLALAGCKHTVLRTVTTHADAAQSAWKQADQLIAAGQFDEAEGAIATALRKAEDAKQAAGSNNTSEDVAAQLRRAAEAAEQARIRQAVIVAEQKTRPQMESIAAETAGSEDQEKVLEVIKGVVCDSMDEVDEGNTLTWDFLYSSIARNVQKAFLGEDEEEKLNERVEAINSIIVVIFQERTASNAAEAFKNAYCNLLG